MFSYSFGFDAQMVDCAYPKHINSTLPRSKLGYTTNNQFPIFPPKMADGRSLISSWNAETAEYENFKRETQEEAFNLSPLSPNWAYRRYMQKNGYQIMAKNFVDTANDTGAEVPDNDGGENIVDKFAGGSDSASRNAPYAFDSLGDSNQPEGYQESNLKDLYLSREQLNARLYAPKL
jgi:hypothetical protein